VGSTRARAGIYVAVDQFAVWIESGFFEHILYDDAHAIHSHCDANVCSANINKTSSYKQLLHT
jgi:hypothetical protein